MNPVGEKHTTGAAAFIWLYIKPEHQQTTNTTKNAENVIVRPACGNASVGRSYHKARLCSLNQFSINLNKFDPFLPFRFILISKIWYPLFVILIRYFGRPNIILLIIELAVKFPFLSDRKDES